MITIHLEQKEYISLIELLGYAIEISAETMDDPSLLEPDIKLFEKLKAQAPKLNELEK